MAETQSALKASVCRVFILKAPGFGPLRGYPACAKRAAYPDPPPVIPVPESLADPEASSEADPGSTGARNVSSHWGLPRACYRVPCCDRETPVAPRSAGQSLGSPPHPGLEQRRSHNLHSPAGTAAAECPEEEEPPAWEAPAAQISQRAPSPQGRGRLTNGTTAASKHRLQPGNGEGRRTGG